jgi:hypothetical protein
MATSRKKVDAIALLKADHRAVEDLFATFEKARDGARKAAIAEKICNELIIHTIIEEEIFYPAVRGQVEDDLLDESYVEHDGAKMMIAEIMAGSQDDAFYDAKVTVLSEEIKHHVKEEEKPGKGLFAQAKKAGVDMAALGEQMQRRKSELKAAFSRDGASKPETRTFTGGKVTQGRPPAFHAAAPAE